MISYSDILKLGCFTKKEFISLCGSSRSADYYVNKFVAEGYILTVKNGLFCAVDVATGGPAANKYQIATKLSSDAVVSYHSALEYYGWYNQVFNTVYVKCKHNFKPLQFDNVNFVSVFNQQSIGITENSGVCITDPELTVVDCINRIALGGGFEELVEAIKMIPFLDESKMLKYLSKFNNKFLYAKTGYLFETYNPELFSGAFYDKVKKYAKIRRQPVDKHTQAGMELVKKWNLYVPSLAMNKEALVV